MIDDQEELLLSDEHREEQTSKDKKERGNGTSGPKNGLHDRVAVSSETQESMFTDNHQHHHGHHGHSHMTADIFQDRPDSMFSFFIVFFATSIHSLLEGKERVSVGSQLFSSHSHIPFLTQVWHSVCNQIYRRQFICSLALFCTSALFR